MKFFSRLYEWYYYLFYLDYLWQSKPGIKWGSPELAALYALAFIFLVNFVSLIVLFQITLFGTSFLEFLIKDKLNFLILVIIPTAALHNFLFLHQNKYKKIIQYYEKYPVDKKRGAIIHWIYVVGSLVVFGALLFLGVYLGKNNMIPLVTYFQKQELANPAPPYANQIPSSASGEDVFQHTEGVKNSAHLCISLPDFKNNATCEAVIQNERTWCLQNRKAGNLFYSTLNCKDDEQMLKTASEGF